MNGTWPNPWSAIPDWMKHLAVGVGLGWAASAVFAEQAVAPARISGLEAWRKEHDSWGHVRSREIDAEIRGLRRSLEDLMDEVDSLRCRQSALHDRGNILDC